MRKNFLEFKNQQRMLLKKVMETKDKLHEKRIQQIILQKQERDLEITREAQESKEKILI